MARNIVKESVLVLNRYYLAVQVSTVQNSVKALVTGHAKVINEIYQTFTLQEWATHTHDFEGQKEHDKKYAGLVRSPSIRIWAPRVIIFTECEYTSPLIKTVKYSRRNIYERDNYVCQYCGDTFSKEQLNLDHVVPRSRGGPSSWKNVVTSCKICNDKKGDKLVSELGWKLIQQPKSPKWKSHGGRPFSLSKQKYWEKFLN